MQLIDVNVLVYAHRPDLPLHAQVAPWLEALVNGATTFGIPAIALSGFVRIVTQKPFVPPTPIGVALDFCATLIALPVCRIIQPGLRHWPIFDDLCRRIGATGKLVPDAYFAAMAIELSAEWVTTDGDFARFPGLTWRHP